MKTRKEISTVGITSLLALLATGFSCDAEASVNANLNIDPVAIAQAIASAKGAESSYPEFVKSTLLKVSNALKDASLHVVVFNLEQEFKNGLLELGYFEKVVKNDRTYGIWVFKCGTFMNKADLGWQHWAYNGPFTNFAQGKGVIFWHQNCLNAAYRKGNYVQLDHKDYHQAASDHFFDVESIDECYAWTLEKEGSLAIYDADHKVCIAKQTHSNGGTTYDNQGRELGKYDLYYSDKAETGNIAIRDSWFKNGDCDAVHSRDGRHWCKQFVSNHNRYVILRRS